MSEILGISGYAGCGKDLFFRLFEEEMKKVNGKTVSRVAIADTLKYEVRASILELKGIDPTECTPNQKEEIRDFLIFYGLQRRNETLGRYWVEKTSDIVKRMKSDFICVTDIRFNFYPHDEVYWLKNEMRGKLLVIKQFVYEPLEIGVAKPVKDYQVPPNFIEEKNMKQIEKEADYFIEWPFCCFLRDDKDHINENLRPAVKEFILKNYESKN